MSIWHEVQVEHALDAEYAFQVSNGGVPAHPDLRKTLAEALDKASDLPEDDDKAALILLSVSMHILFEAQMMLPDGDSKPLRVLRNRIIDAKAAITKTAEEINAH